MWWSTGKHPNMVDAAEQWLPEVEELKASATVYVANGHRLDKNGDVMDILEFDGIGANVDGTANGGESNASQLETRESLKYVGEVVEEEVVEFEFKKLKRKLATHSMHCPNCKSEISKVILRRKVLSYRPRTKQPAPVVPGHGGGYFPSYIHRPESSIATIDKENEPGDFPGFYPRPESPIATEEDDTTIDMEDEPGDFIAFFHRPENDDTTINIVNEPEPIVVASSRGRSWLGYNGLLAEILKSIVYGGLMEVIISLSVVASAAASDATTMSIISVALASLIGWFFVIRHNLWDLRDDCYHDNSDNEVVNKYKELLGQVNYFPLHAFFAILSFIVFGIVPVVAYGYSFHQTNDKDFTLVAVTTASLLCVALLAIFKAYINRCTVIEFFKTVVYYVTTAVSMSGVSYVARNLVTRLMEEWGLFGPSSGGGMSFFPDATASLASF